MLAHISVSHLGLDGGDEAIDVPPQKPVGLLGADFELVNGRYRIARIYEGDNSHPLLTSPLCQPGVDARVNDYLLEVDGKPIDGSKNLYAFFEGLGRKPVEIKLGPHPDGTDSHTAVVRLLPGENTLRRYAWSQGNRRRVEELSHGRLGYIYLPDTGIRGFERFVQQFYAQVDKGGLVIDERFNSGGAPADYFVETLARRPLSGYAFRDGADLPFPLGVSIGPRVMIINHAAGSGGDTLPWMFRRAGLGPLVGTRTMGGGIGGFVDIPELIDGGRISIPNRGFYNPDGGWDIENFGVAPDHEVEILPRDWRAGRDAQLEKAVELALKALDQEKPRAARRPEYPVYP
jgi:tricorn protease